MAIDIFDVAAKWPGPRAGAEAIKERVVKQLRRHCLESVARIVFASLRSLPEDLTKQLEHTPWLTLLILKWALLDAKVPLKSTNPITLQTFNRLRLEMWQVDLIDRDRPFNIHRFVRSRSHVQLEFQRRPSADFLRLPILLSEADRQSKLRKKFAEAFEMEPEVFLDLVQALMTGMHEGNGELKPEYVMKLNDSYAGAAERVIRLFANNLAGLRAQMQSDPDARRSDVRVELGEFPYLQRFPLVHMNSGGVRWWHPLVFARGMEDAVHLRLSRWGKEYTDDFSKLFERYVEELARETGLSVIDEREYKRSLGPHSRAVEAVLRDGGCNVLVEAKMGLFAESAMVADREREIFEKTNRIREAIAQTAEVAAQLQLASNPFHDAGHATTYALIVTSRELNIGSGVGLQQLLGDRPISLSTEAAQALPLERIFVVSIADFERLVGAVRLGRLRLADVLRRAEVANTDAATRTTHFMNHLGDSWRSPEAMSARIRGAVIASHSRLAEALGVPT